MKPIKPLLCTIATLATLAFLTGGCEKPATSTATNNDFSKPLPTTQASPPPVQAEPFHGQVYKSVDGRHVVTLTSKDECELTQDGGTLLCKYTKQKDALRVIATVMGTTQVLYFRFTDKGLQDNDGNILLSPEQYAASLQRIGEERQRVANEQLLSSKETKIISTFALQARDEGDPDGVIVTDVSLRYHFPKPDSQSKTILFSQIAELTNLEGVDDVFIWFSVHYQPKPNTFYAYQRCVCKSTVEAEGVKNAILNAFEAWKKKFPIAVLH
jgi:hypothetical protein